MQHVTSFYTDYSESLFLSVGRWSFDRESDGQGFTVLMMTTIIMMVLNHTASFNNINFLFYVITVVLCFKIALMNCHTFWFT